ncbi:RNase P/MRP, p29 subunit [Massarina eburnea CBS 473.64]|uniref:Ribonuclease P protein subunit n=1 Tax=Massarina eburnea CBS 473.64 TaxID=1395130 RepID=A0A6A6SC69_9PLEO|nr:RNase P/MRP, p29 subunit [Massarina eburnea CBS 473.64]
MAEPLPFGQVLLARAHPPSTAEKHYEERVLKRPLHIRANSPTPSTRALRRQTLNARKEKAQKRSKQKPRPLSAAKKRSMGLLEMPKEQQKYTIYEGLHNLWCGYMRELLNVGASGTQAYVTAASSGLIVASADMHGAEVEVVRSRCVSRVGIKGIVVKDTKFTFEIITAGNKVKDVPKEHTMFRFEVPLVRREGEEERRPLVFEILGEMFQARGADRANKKFRMHYQPDV